MITFEPVYPQPVCEEKIIIDGNIIGTVKPYKEEFMASLSIAKGPDFSPFFTAGFGATKEAAIKEALIRGNAQARQILAEVDQIMAVLGEVMP